MANATHLPNARALLSILRSPAWPALARRLDAAVAQDDRLKTAREILMRPVQLLDLMARDSEGALGDDVLQANRLRMLLYMSAPYIAWLNEAEDQSAKISETKSAARSLPYEPGVIDHGALMIVALAAVRVSSEDTRQLFLHTLHGLALAAAPAEVLGRLDPREPDADSLAVILNTLYLLEAVGTTMDNPFLRPFSRDPVERGRWQCLTRLFRQSALQPGRRPPHTAGEVWDGAFATGIERIDPSDAAPGQEVAIVGDLAAYVDGNRLRKGIQVVFASPDRPPRAAKFVKSEKKGDQRVVRVEVPVSAEPGWIGFSDEAKREASNRYRRDVRQLLGSDFNDPDCLCGARIPVDRVPDLGLADPTVPQRMLAVPPRTGANRFEGGRPRLVYADVTPSIVPPAGELRLQWESMGATHVTVAPDGITLPAAGQHRLRAPATDGAVSYVLTPVFEAPGGARRGDSITLDITVRSPSRIAAIHVTQEGRRSEPWFARDLDVSVLIEPPSSHATGYLVVSRVSANADSETLRPQQSSSQGPPRLGFVIPARLVHDGMTFTVFLTEEDGAPPSDQRACGPLSVVTTRRANVMLLRPRVLSPNLAPIPLESATDEILRAGATVGLRIGVHELPYVDDALAVLTEQVRDAGDPRMPMLLEQLARRAMLTPGFEQALWVLLLPREERPVPIVTLRSESFDQPADGQTAGMQTSLPCAAALAVAVSDVAGLPALFSTAFASALKSWPSPRVTTRLRVLGEYNGTEIKLETVQEETRDAGPGGPLATELMAVMIDASERELQRLPIAFLHPSRPTQLELLLPVSEAVHAVEVRRSLRAGMGTGREPALLRLVRPSSPPALDHVNFANDDHLEWTYQHPRGVRPQLGVALVRDGVRTQVLRFDPCSSSARLPLTRFERLEGVELFAADGWNVATQRIDEEFDNEFPVLVRRLAQGRFWADVPDGWRVRWTLDDASLGHGARMLDLPPETRGTLRLHARLDASGPMREDMLELGGDAYDG